MLGGELLKGTAGGLDLSPDLVAHYLLNNNAHDNVAEDDGTLSSGGVDFQSDAVDFNGTTGYIDAMYDGFTNGCSLSVWVKGTGTFLVTDYQSSTYRGMMITIDADDLTLNQGDGTGAGPADRRTYSSTESFADIANEYHHIFINYTSFNTFDVYVNNVELTMTYISGTATTISFSTSYNMRIGGAMGSTDAGYWDGVISNLRIYDAEKDTDFISALYDEGYYPKPLMPPRRSNLITFLPMTGGSDDLGTAEYTYSEDVSYIDDAEFGSIAQFDGSTDEFTTNSVYNHSKGTICFWFKEPATSSTYIFGQADDDVNTYYLTATIGPSYVTLIVKSATVNNSIRGLTTVMEDGDWHHVAYQSTGSAYKFYVDGAVVTTSAITGSDDGEWLAAVQGVADGFDIGRLDLLDTTSYSSQKIRNFRLYDDDLTAQELEDIYLYEKNFRYVEMDDGLVAYYPLTDNSNDNYKNQHDGTDTAMSYDGVGADFSGGTTARIDCNIGTTQDLYGMSFWMYNASAITSGSTQAAIGTPNQVNTTSCLFLGDLTGNLTNETFSMLDWRGAQLTSVYQAITDTIPAGWNNIFILWTGSEYEIYLNGAVGTNITYGLASQTIAKCDPKWGDRGLNDFPWGGKLSKLRIYNKTLGAEQIQAIYNLEKGDFA